MKVVCFKIEGEKYTRMGPCLPDSTPESITKHLASVFSVPEKSITILELN